MTGTVNPDLVGYFGFGSLVNTQTLRTSYVDHVPARLKGWRRHWQARSSAPEHIIGSRDDLLLLSIHEDPQCLIKGAIVIDHAANLPEVDERESGYNRILLDQSVLDRPDDVEMPENIYVYVADTSEKANDGQGALLQSYLDAVLKGYCDIFGEDGVKSFIETTIGFDRPIIADRQAPLYPRSVEISPVEVELFDHALKNAGVRYS